DRGAQIGIGIVVGIGAAVVVGDGAAGRRVGARGADDFVVEERAAADHEVADAVGDRPAGRAIVEGVGADAAADRHVVLERAAGDLGLTLVQERAAGDVGVRAGGRAVGVEQVVGQRQAAGVVDGAAALAADRLVRGEGVVAQE